MSVFCMHSYSCLYLAEKENCEHTFAHGLRFKRFSLLLSFSYGCRYLECRNQLCKPIWQQSVQYVALVVRSSCVGYDVQMCGYMIIICHLLDEMIYSSAIQEWVFDYHASYIICWLDNVRCLRQTCTLYHYDKILCHRRIGVW